MLAGAPAIQHKKPREISDEPTERVNMAKK
jgi:hypothetical protein